MANPASGEIGALQRFKARKANFITGQRRLNHLSPKLQNGASTSRPSGRCSSAHLRPRPRPRNSRLIRLPDTAPSTLPSLVAWCLLCSNTEATLEGDSLNGFTMNAVDKTY